MLIHAPRPLLGGPSPHHPLPNQAVLSNLSFAFWPDNARAGMALLEAPAGAFRQDGTQALSPEWFKLYLAWNANFIWPSHYCADMMCFTMLAMPTIALGSPEAFQYNRAHSLFWVAQPAQSALPWHCPRSAPAPPQRAPGASVQLGTPRVRPGNGL